MQRLFLAKKDAFLQNTQQFLKEIIEKNQSKLISETHIHYDGIGIIPVLESKKDPTHELKYDFEGQYALKNMKKLSKQKDLLEEKNNIQQRKFEQIQLEYAKKDKKLLNKRQKIKTLKDQKTRLEEEISRYKQITEFYQNRNPIGLKRLQVSTLTHIEQALYSLLDSIKTQKVIIKMQEAINQQSPNTPSSQLTIEQISKVGLQLSSQQPCNDKSYEFPEQFYDIPNVIQKQTPSSQTQTPLVFVHQPVQPTINPLQSDSSFQYKITPSIGCSDTDFNNLNNFGCVTKQTSSIDSTQLDTIQTNNSNNNTQIYNSCNPLASTNILTTNVNSPTTIPQVNSFMLTRRDTSQSEQCNNNNLSSFQNYFNNHKKELSSGSKEDQFLGLQTSFIPQQQAILFPHQQKSLLQNTLPQPYHFSLDQYDSKIQMLDEQLKRSKEELQNPDQTLDTEASQSTQNFKVPLQHLNTEERENRCVTNSSISDLKDDSDLILGQQNLLIPQSESKQIEKLFGKENQFVQYIKTNPSTSETDSEKNIKSQFQQYSPSSQYIQPSALPQFFASQQINSNQLVPTKLNFKKNNNNYSISRNQAINNSSTNCCEGRDSDLMINGSNNKGLSQTISIAAKGRISDVDLDMYKIYSPSSGSESSSSQKNFNKQQLINNKKPFQQTLAL